MQHIMVDVHAHLDFPEIISQIDNIMGRAEAAGVRAIITNGIEMESNQAAFDLSARFSTVKAAIGLYPPDALSQDLGRPIDIVSELAFIKENADRAVAIGEIGLDFVDSSPAQREEQERTFTELVNIAKDHDKPVIVHSRKAELRAIELLEASGHRKVVMHCFSGKKKLVQRIAKNRWYFSIPTNIVRAQNFQLIVQDVSMSQILTETDTPFLSPFKDRMNEPSFITESVKKIAEIKGMDIHEVERAIFYNYQKLFL